MLFAEESSSGWDEERMRPAGEFSGFGHCFLFLSVV